MFRVIIFSFITLHLCLYVFCDIHRAKSYKNKLNHYHGIRLGSRSKFSNEWFDFTNDAVLSSNVYFGHTLDTWIYSLCSSILVGLSGIFPLIVIPLNANLSGGESIVLSTFVMYYIYLCLNFHQI